MLGRVPLLWAAALASLAYAIATLVLGVWDKKEWELLRGLLRLGPSGA